MKLYGATPSPFFRKAHVVLEEKNVSYEIESLGPFPKTPELLAMHPLGKIPILEDQGAFIPDSSVICAYVERLHPSPALYPSDPREFARALFIEEYCDTKVVEVVGGIFFQRYVRPNIFKQEPDEAAVDELRGQLPPIFEWLESQAPESGESIFSEFSIADVSIGAHMGGLHFAGETFDTSTCPKLGRYVEALFARPSFKTAMSMSD